MKYLKLYENYNNLIGKSLNSKKLYEKLLPLFEPSYRLDRPSGHSLEVIEMRFNENTTFDVVKDIIEDSKWYIVKNRIDDDVVKWIEIRPVYSDNYVSKLKKYYYHISPSYNDGDILKNGIVANNHKKLGIYFPNRIYFVDKVSKFDLFYKELFRSEKNKEFSIWKIDMSKMDIDYLYVDETVEQNLFKPDTFYIQNIDIPPNIIEKIKTIN